MFIRIRLLFLIACMGFVSCVTSQQPKLYILDYKTRSALNRQSVDRVTNSTRARTERGYRSLPELTTPEEEIHHLDSFMNIADAALKRSGYSVVVKGVETPSGDPHDFFTIAPYYWPDPSKPDGKPYIHKDGQTNPEIRKYQSHATVFNLCRDVKALGIAYQHTGDEKYAQQAAKFTRMWFLDDETKMNPNLRYAQHIPGRTDGRGIGLVDVYYFIDLIDGIQLISQSEAWSDVDMKSLKIWFSDFLGWMLTSKQGREAADHKNNIGTYYELQVLSYALFTGQHLLARRTIRNSIIPRIDEQFEIDGRQPLEVERTRGWTYAEKNLQGWFYLSMLAEELNIDLWNYRTSSNRSLRSGFEWMLQYAEGQKKWPYQQISKADMQPFQSLVLEASARYPEVNHREIKVRALQR